MHFVPQLEQNQIAAALERTIAIGTLRRWESRIDQFDQELRENPFMQGYNAQRHGLAIAMDKVRRYRKKTGRIPDVTRADAGTYRLYAFAGMLAATYERLPVHAQKALAGRLRGGLGDDHGTASLAFEFLIASNLLQSGGDVEWHDLESGGGFDFLVRRGTVEFEVECKTFSADVGRKIHHRRQYQLGGLLQDDLGAALEMRGSFFVEAEIADRLTGSALTELAAVIRRSLTSWTDIAAGGGAMVRLHPLNTEELPFDWCASTLSEEVITGFLEKRFGLFNPFVIAHIQPRTGIALLSVRSAKPDELATGIYRDLKHGARQLSATRPGALCAHFLDLTPPQIQELHREQERGTVTGLNLVATRLFNGNRPSLHTVQFSSPGFVRRSERTTDTHRHKSLRENGLCLTFVNKQHPQAGDQAYRLAS